MTDRRGLEQIGQSVDDYLTRLGMPTAVALTDFVESWESVAGEPFSGLATPVRLQDGELVVEVADGSAASLLKYQLGKLLDRLQERFGAETVARIKIRVGTSKKGR